MMNNTGGNKRDLSACLQPIQKMYAEVEDKMIKAAWDGNDKEADQLTAILANIKQRIANGDTHHPLF